MTVSTRLETKPVPALRYAWMEPGNASIPFEEADLELPITGLELLLPPVNVPDPKVLPKPGAPPAVLEGPEVMPDSARPEARRFPVLVPDLLSL